MTTKTQKMLQGTAILGIAGILAKIISAFYKVPLTRAVGTEGVALYQLVYPLYALLTAAGLIGIPNSISKLVAEEVAKGNYKKAHQTFRYAFILTAVFGLAVSLIFVFFNQQIIQLSGWNSDTNYVFLGFSVAPFFISIAGALRGYFQGMHIMTHTAVSQVIENLFKVLVGIGLVYILGHMGYPIEVQVGGAALGASVGFILSALYMLIMYLVNRDTFKQRIHIGKEADGFKKVSLRISSIAIPITITSAALSIMTFIDSITLPNIMTSETGGAVSEGEYIIGILGKTQTVINVPLMLSVSLIISIVPAIAAANVDHNKTELKSKIVEAIQIAVKLAIPSAVGIAVLSKPVLKFLFQTREGSDYLVIFAICLVFMVFSQSIIGILQGLSKYYKVLWIILGSAIVKTGLNIVLIPLVGGHGALYGTIGYYFFIAVLCYRLLRQEVDFHINWVHTFVKPIIAALLMGISVYGTERAIFSLLGDTTTATILGVGISIIIGVMVYVIAMVLLKAFSHDELSILPFRNRILKFMESHGYIDDAINEDV